MLTQETAYYSVRTTKLFTNHRRDFREYRLIVSDSIVFFFLLILRLLTLK